MLLVSSATRVERTDTGADDLLRRLVTLLPEAWIVAGPVGPKPISDTCRRGQTRPFDAIIIGDRTIFVLDIWSHAGPSANRQKSGLFARIHDSSDFPDDFWKSFRREVEKLKALLHDRFEVEPGRIVPDRIWSRAQPFDSAEDSADLRRFARAATRHDKASTFPPLPRKAVERVATFLTEETRAAPKPTELFFSDGPMPTVVARTPAAPATSAATAPLPPAPPKLESAPLGNAEAAEAAAAPALARSSRSTRTGRSLLRRAPVSPSATPAPIAAPRDESQTASPPLDIEPAAVAEAAEAGAAAPVRQPHPNRAEVSLPPAAPTASPPAPAPIAMPEEVSQTVSSTLDAELPVVAEGAAAVAAPPAPQPHPAGAEVSLPAAAPVASPPTPAPIAAPEEASPTASPALDAELPVVAEAAGRADTAPVRPAHPTPAEDSPPPTAPTPARIRRLEKVAEPTLADAPAPLVMDVAGPATSRPADGRALFDRALPAVPTSVALPKEAPRPASATTAVVTPPANAAEAPAAAYATDTEASLEQAAPSLASALARWRPAAHWKWAAAVLLLLLVSQAGTITWLALFDRASPQPQPAAAAVPAPTPAPAAPTPAPFVVRALATSEPMLVGSETATLRAGPSPDFQAVGELEPGTEVVARASAGGPGGSSWIEVTAPNGAIGFVPDAMVQSEPAPALALEPAAPPKQTPTPKIERAAIERAAAPKQSPAPRVTRAAAPKPIPRPKIARAVAPKQTPIAKSGRTTRLAQQSRPNAVSAPPRVDCILPGGEQIQATRSDCRAQSGIIYQ